MQRWYPRDRECPHAGEPWISSAESQRSGVAKPQLVTEPFLLNCDATAALARLLERARALGSSELEHYVFPACEERIIDPSRPQKSWRTAWRKRVRETARRVGREAAQQALDSGKAFAAQSQAGNEPPPRLAENSAGRFHANLLYYLGPTRSDTLSARLSDK